MDNSHCRIDLRSKAYKLGYSSNRNTTRLKNPNYWKLKKKRPKITHIFMNKGISLLRNQHFLMVEFAIQFPFYHFYAFFTDGKLLVSLYHTYLYVCFRILQPTGRVQRFQGKNWKISTQLIDKCIHIYINMYVRAFYETYI